jgi:putative hydrolase of the HAD superfamily
MTAITAVISDFGGVLTSPLEPAMRDVFEQTGVSLTDLGLALAAVTEAHGANPLFELESGRMTEAAFIQTLSAALSQRVGRPVTLDGFGETLFTRMTVNEPFVAYLALLRERGLALGLCTNNVREWEAHWRSMVAIEELFDVVIDSSAVGLRKPEPRIYELTLEGLGIDAGQAVFVDDLEVNCNAARELGMQAVVYHDAQQAIAELEAVLGPAA